MIVESLATKRETWEIHGATLNMEFFDYDPDTVRLAYVPGHWSISIRKELARRCRAMGFKYVIYSLPVSVKRHTHSTYLRTVRKQNFYATEL